MPLNGIVTSNLDIIALENSKPDSYILPIFANINITTEAIPRRSTVTGDILYNPLPQNLVRTSNLTITVLPSLTIMDYINNLKTISTPITDLITFATALGGVGGLVFGFVKWIRRKKQKKKEYYY